MRMVLARILLDEKWAWTADNGIPLIGVGWLCIPWLIYAAWWIRQERRKPPERRADLRGAAIVWSIPLLAAFFMPATVAPEGVPIFGYGFMLFVGFSLATLYAVWRVKQEGKPADTIWDMMMWLFLPGIVGGRLFYIAQYYDQVVSDAAGFEKLKALVNLSNGGLVLYGALGGGVAGFLAYCFRRKLSPPEMADIVIPSLFIGIGFGRIGCFLYGCCFGDVCSLPWAVSFPADSMTFQRLVAQGLAMPGDAGSPPLHPTQLYSSINAFVLAGLFIAWYRFRPFNGFLALLGWMLYPISRFTIELLRNDEPGRLNTGQTISQLVSIGTLLVAGGLMVYLLIRKPEFTRIRSGSVPTETPA